MRREIELTVKTDRRTKFASRYDFKGNGYPQLRLKNKSVEVGRSEGWSGLHMMCMYLKPVLRC